LRLTTGAGATHTMAAMAFCASRLVPERPTRWLRTASRSSVRQTCLSPTAA
jgi:hypothetical protein